ncbi:MAG TPA: FecR domain-containing protein [Cyclobacteriaceae bacterium]|nr:FecR domain-containing protein [Cyclobacteriaceae bacterium]
MDKAESWSLIARHLTRSSTPEEERALMSWTQSSPENKRTFDDALRIWNLTEKHYTLPDFEIQAEWQAFLQKVENEKKQPRGQVVRLWQSLRTPAKIAAGIFLIAFISWMLWPRGTTTEIVKEIVAKKPVLAVFSTKQSVQRITLPDSSLVWMNTFSELRFDSAFTHRRVLLTGEAYFQVRPESTPPFTVESHGARVMVTGTAFNVNAKNKKQLQVTVVSGNVELRAADSTRAEKIVLHAKEKGIFNTADSTFRSSKNNDPAFLNWRKKNNTVYDTEKKSPEKFLQNKYSTRKNAINQTLIEGKITNTASIASYQKIRLTILSVNARGKKSKQYIQVSPNTPLLPGKSIDYKQTLFDVLSSKTEVTIVVEGARAN